MIFWIRKDFRNKKKAYILKAIDNLFKSIADITDVD